MWKTDRNREWASEVADELAQLDAERQSVVGLLDRDTALRSAVRHVPAELGVEVGIGGLLQDDGTLVLRTLYGHRTEALGGLVVMPGLGVGGKVLATRTPVTTSDYVKAGTITHEYDAAVSAEGLHGMLAAPITHDRSIYGVLYAAARYPTVFGDIAIASFERLAGRAGLAVSFAERAHAMAEVGVLEERQRIALALHDSVGAMLFGIGAAARDLSSDAGCDRSLLERLRQIEKQVAEASAALRQAVQAFSDVPAEFALARTLEHDAREFARETGIRTKVIPLDRSLIELDAARSRALVTVAREALFNVRKHARAKSVVMTLYALNDGVGLAVSDDGSGMAELPSEGEKRPPGLGLRANAERLARLGGRFSVISNEDAGVTVRAWVPR